MTNNNTYIHTLAYMASIQYLPCITYETIPHNEALAVTTIQISTL